LHGYLNYYGAKNAKNIALGNRAAIVKDLGAYTKRFVNTEEFKNEYREHRELSKPQMPKKAKNIDEVREEQVTAMKKSITQLEAMQKMDNADLRKMAAENVGALKKQLKELEDPNNPLIKMMADGEKMRYEIDMKNFDDNYKKWEKENPENHMLLVKSRLQKFLDVTADVDFQAALKEQYGKKRFVNPAYESKPDEWKQAFRAGKEATEAARAFAKQWLSEIG
jgi:monoamine oxidase